MVIKWRKRIMTETTLQVRRRKDKQKQYSTTVPKQLMKSMNTRDKDKLVWTVIDRDNLNVRIIRK